MDLTSITTFGTAVSAMITKALPSDELQLARFKIRYPLLYARIREHMIRNIVNYCKSNKLNDNATVAAIRLFTSALPVDEENEILVIVKDELEKK